MDDISNIEPELFKHQASKTTGVLDSRFDKSVAHFRGIKYARIAERFAAPVLESRDTSKTTRSISFGPRCPQIPVDVRDLMQIPKHLGQYAPETEHEFECLNLNITVPANNTKKIPVLIWIYGGAQVVSFASAANRLCETGPLVAQSIASNQPIILVTPNYRLNILAYGDGQPSSEKNLQIQDLQAAVIWVHNNITAFGGDTSRITIAGESAGSFLTHGLCRTLPPSVPIYRAILCSGALPDRFPPPSLYEPVLSRVLTTIRDLAAQQSHPNAQQLTLRNAPIPLLVASMAINAINSIPGQEPTNRSALPTLHGSLNRLDALMLGDCDFEGIIWLGAIRLLSDAAIRAAFLGSSSSEQPTQALTAAYLDNPTASAGHSSIGLSPSQAAALSFISDQIFHKPNHAIINALTNAPQTATKLYTYAFDEPNPFVSQSTTTAPACAAAFPTPVPTGVPRAHHAVDLLALFNSYAADYPPNHPFTAIAHTYRTKILTFVNGGEPWPGTSAPAAASTDNKRNDVYAYAFGPDGQHGTIDFAEYASRRRTKQWVVMQEVGEKAVEGVLGRLMEGMQSESLKVMKGKVAEGRGSKL